MAWVVADSGRFEGTIGDTLGIRFRCTVVDEDDNVLDMRGHDWVCQVRRRRTSDEAVIEGVLISDDSTADLLSLWFEVPTTALLHKVEFSLGVIAVDGPYAEPQWTLIAHQPIMGLLGAAREEAP